MAEIRDAGLMPLATPFSPGDLPLAESLNLPAVKIASPDLVNRPCSGGAAQLGKPLLVSTGAATMDEVAQAVGWLGEWGAPFALLHCVSSYPTPAGIANLCWIGELARAVRRAGRLFRPHHRIAGRRAGGGGGGVVVEKHLTYDRAAHGPDHAASADPGQFARYVELIRTAEVLRGRPASTCWTPSRTSAA